MNTLVEVLIVGLILLNDIGTPLLLVTGWIRWSKQPKVWSITSILSLIGFGLASASALLALGSMGYAQVHRFGFYDPLLLRIYRWGCLLSLSGFCLGLGGALRKNSLRWFTPACGFGTLIFWVFAAAGE